MKYNMIQTM